MSRKNASLTVVGMGMLGILAWVVAGIVTDDGTALVEWGRADEMTLSAADTAGEVDPMAGDLDVDRVSIDETVVTGNPATTEDRPVVGISGRVLNAFGRPLEAVTVVLDIKRGRGRTRAPGRNRIRKPLTTGADGRFEFRGAGFSNLAITLRLTHEEHAPQFVDRQFEPDQRELDVGDLTMQLGAVVVGSVTDREGVGVPEATVHLLPERGHRLMWDPDRDDLLGAFRTDQNGFFRVAKLMPGDYRAQAAAPRRMRARSDVFHLENGGEQHLDPIRLGPGFRLTGTVFAPDGRGVEGADVRVLRISRGSSNERGKTDARGEFAFDHLAAAKVALRVTAKGYVTYHEAEFDPSNARPLVIRLQAGLTLAGVVYDTQTGAPVTRYAARARRVGALPEAARAVQEAQELEAVQHRLERLGATDLGKQLTKGRARAERVAAELRTRITAARRRAAAALRARTPQNARVAGTRRRPPARIGDVLPRPEGRFAFPGLDAGVYVVEVDSPEHQFLSSERVEVRAGQTTTQLTLHADSGLAVSGRVMSAKDGVAVAQARVDLVVVTAAAPKTENVGSRWQQLFQGNVAPRGFPVRAAEADDQGRFRFEHAPPGRYAVTSRQPGFAFGSSDPFELHADLEGIEVELGDLCAIAGTARGIPGDEPESVRVMVFGGPGRTQTMQVDAGGGYRVEDLEPGGYVVRAFAGPVGTFLAREMRRYYSSNDADLRLDVILEAGDEKTFDPVVTVAPVGSITGTVLHNGEPGHGLQVALTSVDNQPPQGPGAGGFGGFGRISKRTRTDQRGEFVYRSIPAGRYRLTVRAAGRSAGRRRGGAELYGAELDVHQGIESHRAIALTSSTVSGTIHTDDGGKLAGLDGSLRLFAGATERPADPRARPTHTLRVRNGRIVETELSTGNYFAVLQLQDRQPSEQQLTLVMGPNTLDLTAGTTR